MEEIKKILEALEKGDEKLLLSDVSCSFTLGDLKQMLLSAIVKGRMVSNGGEKMEDWQKYDNEKWHLTDLINNYRNYN
jgi:hypothetical protein